MSEQKSTKSPFLGMTRRDVLKVGTVAALPLINASCAMTKEKKPKSTQLTIGIATTGFRDYTNAQLAEVLAQEDIKTIQLFLSQSDSNYWKYNGRSDLSDLTAKRCDEIANIYRSAGISIHSIGVYTNLIHKDEAERSANLAYFDGMMKVGADMGVYTFITEAGHYQPKPPGRFAYHFLEEVWQEMVATGKKLAELAERRKATVLVEPYYGNFLASAKRTRMYLEEVGSPRIRALLDPANLMELNDIEEMFDQLDPWIECFHAKDRKLHVVRGVAAGQGDLDYRKFITMAAERKPHLPLIIEYVGRNNYKQALEHLRNTMREVGVGWK